MNDYSISRWNALNAMCDNCDAMQPSTGVCTHFPCTRYRAVEKLKPAQPERKKGRWIPVDSYSAFGGDEATWMAHGNPVAFYYCSKCKEQAYAGEDGESLLTAYCPNCGAELVGTEEADGED